MKIYDQIPPNLIFLDLCPKEKEQLLKDIVANMKEKGFISNERKILEKLLEREHLCCTALEKGIAVPHALIDIENPPLVALARIKEGVNFESADRMPTYIIMMLLGNKNDPGSHLRFLARICRLVKETQFVEKARQAETPSEILAILKEEEKKI
ncbi:MAG: PTS sugar transporter subunit IIA [Candidatus Aminicenantes bacterium]|nr:PTS sugar transporter subunit IIA [Candidatus Aminicenantes bacterium]